MAGRVAGKIKLQTVDELLGVPEIAGTQEIEIVRIIRSRYWMMKEWIRWLKVSGRMAY